MGLESFTTDDSNSTDKQLSKADSSSVQTYNSGAEQAPSNYKVIGSGASKITFETEDDWESFVTFVEQGLGFDISTVLGWSEDKRRDFIGHAHSFRNDELLVDEHEVTQECLVCGKEYVFPNNWDFILFKHQAVCKSHTMGEVAQAYEQLHD